MAQVERVAAEARLSETALGGLYEKARDASRPGLQVRISRIDFTPTLAERESTLGTLRARIYGRVRDELIRLNEIYPDRDYRVHLIDFTGTHVVPQARRAQPARAMRLEAAAPADAAPVSVSAKLIVNATAILAATPKP